MSVRIYDTATQQVREFVPLVDGKVGIYLCGMTLQSEPHVGHVRSGLNFEVLCRWLTAHGYEVTFIRNVTDIEDKILAKSAEQGRPWYSLAYAVRRKLDKAYDALNVAPPTYEPAASGHVPAMIDLISTLIGRGHAYAAGDGSGDVYFDVRAWPAYGELTGQRIDDMVPAGRRPARQAGPARLRALERVEGGQRARDRGVAEPVGAVTARLAHRMLGDGTEVPRRGL